ncbi:MAG: helix-turn-helix transcriptional regulator [Lentisphaeraceae bacterium]|nr:helix-turn-helix transcriptional regulator [Lentisphaeraceae bacterium]
MDMKEIASLVKTHRKAAGLTQNELARIAGIGSTTVFDIERGKESIRFINLLKVFKVLNMKLKVTSAYLEFIANEQ